ncbi:MAG: hypothetical protein JXR94_15185 [Candidatus Hydrogenedentes bacterium]|nr:hypothetical protein [Candidatus Hydrogenedentota bacterium]
MMQCHKCGHEWTTPKRVKLPGVKESCEHCSAYLHCCLNCRHYDPGQNNQCRSHTAPWVADKEGCNFCDEFDFADSDATAARDAGEGQARAALDDLFGASGEPTDDENLDRFRNL